MKSPEYPDIIRELFSPQSLVAIADKVLERERISPAEALSLYSDASPGQLSFLADHVCRQKHKNTVFFIRNFHIEPTNICKYHCRFCSYSQQSHKDGGWELSPDEIKEIIVSSDPLAREVHITGGAHPGQGTAQYEDLMRIIRKLRPDIHIKAYSAVEIHHLHEISGHSYEDILLGLKRCGLGSIPGGGAEIFDEEIRQKICPEKVDAKGWLSIHETAHRLGLPTNATMLYGHIENYGHRISHMEAIRELQDKTGGFQAFIPLKFKNFNNKMSDLPEVSLIEDLRNYAVSRIFLDNVPHIKAYWPMLGKSNAQLSLFFGVDDLDGTIQDSTKIYSLAGAHEKQSMSAEQISMLIRQAGKNPVERDALYHAVD